MFWEPIRSVPVRNLFTGILSADSVRQQLSRRWVEKLRAGDWDSRVRAQDFLTEDTGRGHSLGSEIEG